jgi:CheY-like chemotaxis protein
MTKITKGSIKSINELSVLVVEDDLFTSKYLKLLLSDLFHHLDTAGTAKDAFSLIENKVYDLLILDLNLPDMNGIELAQKIKIRHPHSTVIFNSSFVTSEIKNQLSNNGFEFLLPKPIKKDQLIPLIEQAISSTFNGSKQ